MYNFDFIVVGSGAAGLSFAIKSAKDGKVAVITKNKILDTNTARAQGGISCVMSPSDSVELHAKDTEIAGDDLCDSKVVREILRSAPKRIKELIAMGVDFDKATKNGNDKHGEYDLTREGGHSERRILHYRDITGKEILTKLYERAKQEKNISFFEDHYVIDLITKSKLGFASGDHCLGLYALNKKTTEVETFIGKFTVLATGGCGKVYLYTSNPDGATGDGVAIAWRAGAAIESMEFIQFHPTCLYHHKARSFLISESLRGEGAKLIDQSGKTFMQKYDKRGSLAPRDIVARAIDSELKTTGATSVFLDITHEKRDFLQKRFPTIFTKCLSLDIDISKQPIPVVPAAHYQCGGVRTNLQGRTSLKGLYAIGEVASTGLHGANRLASNSLLEAVVMAHNAYEDSTKRLAQFENTSKNNYKIPNWQSGYAVDIDELVVIYHNWDEIRRLMWDYVSIVRTDKRLKRATARLINLKKEVNEFYWHFKVTSDILELRNLVDCASLIVDCATMRKESRGLHYTLDWPKKDNKNWRKTNVVYY